MMRRRKYLKSMMGASAVGIATISSGNPTKAQISDDEYSPEWLSGCEPEIAFPSEPQNPHRIVGRNEIDIPSAAETGYYQCRSRWGNSSLRHWQSDDGYNLKAATVSERGEAWVISASILDLYNPNPFDSAKVDMTVDWEANVGYGARDVNILGQDDEIEQRKEMTGEAQDPEMQSSISPTANPVVYGLGALGLDYISGAVGHARAGIAVEEAENGQFTGDLDHDEDIIHELVDKKDFDGIRYHNDDLSGKFAIGRDTNWTLKPATHYRLIFTTMCYSNAEGTAIGAHANFGVHENWSVIGDDNEDGFKINNISYTASW